MLNNNSVIFFISLVGNRFIPQLIRFIFAIYLFIAEGLSETSECMSNVRKYIDRKLRTKIKIKRKIIFGE